MFAGGRFPEFGILFCIALATAVVLVVSVLVTLWRVVRATNSCARTLRQRGGVTDVAVLSAAHGLVPAGRLYTVADDEPYAICIGLVRPNIYVSTGLVSRLAPDALRAALAHEESHRRRHDALRVLVLQTVLGAICSDLAASTIRARATLRGEIVADRFATSRVSSRALASALLTVLRAPGHRGAGDTPAPQRIPLRPSMSSLVGSPGLSDVQLALEERLRYLTLPPDTPLPAVVPRRADVSLILGLLVRKLWWVGVPAVLLALISLSPLLLGGQQALAVLGCRV